MIRDILRTRYALVLGLAVASVGPTVPVFAEEDAFDKFLGFGRDVLKEVIKEKNNNNNDSGNNNNNNNGTIKWKSAPQNPTASNKSVNSPSGGNFVNSTEQTQRALAGLGYDPGPVDGQMGGKTRRAIEAFQSDRGYPVTGKLTTEQFASMNTSYSMRVSPPAPGQMTKAATYEAQLYLKNLGYDVGNPDGVWGPKSQAALDTYRATTSAVAAGGLAGSDLEALHMQVHGTPSMSLAMVAPGSIELGSVPPGNLQSDGQQPNGSGLHLDLNSPGGAGSGLQLGSVPAPAGLGGQQPGKTPAPAGLGTGGGTGLGAGGTVTPGTTLAAKPPGAVNVLPPADPSAYVHLSDRPVEGMTSVGRRIAVQMVKARPKLLEDMSNIQAWFSQDHPRAGQPSALRKAYEKSNGIQREDVLRKFRAELIAEINATPATSAETPQPVAFYQPVSFGAYVDGQGLELRGKDIAQFAWRYSTRYLSAFATMRADLPGTALLDISRQEAAQLIDFVKASEQRLFRVVWGQILTVGEDTTVADFAKSTGQFGTRDVATTFAVDQVTLNLAQKAYQSQPKVERTLYKFDLKSAPKRGVGTPVFSFLQQRGVPTMNGHLLLGNGTNGQRLLNEIKPGAGQTLARAMEQLTYLTWLKLNPDFAKKDMNFVSVAARVMTDAEKRQFFGDGMQSLNYYKNNASYESVGSYGSNVFPDEFAAQDAKQAFLTSYYPRVLATLPEWPVPVIQIIGARLGSYDFEKRAFPIVYDGVSPGQAIAPRVVAMTASKNRAALVSADRLAALPQELPVTVDEARELRKDMAGNNRVYLGWTALFDMDEDGTGHELLIDPSGTHHKQTGVRPGRATLNRLALFRDPGLMQVLQEYDPAVMIQDPTYDTPPELGEGPEAILASMKLAEPFQLLKSAVELIADESVTDKVIDLHQGVRSANEFDVDGSRVEARAYWTSITSGDVWFQGQAQLGRYNRTTGIFPFVEQQSQGRLTMGRENPFSAYANPQFIGQSLFDPLEIAEETAREIVAGEMRTIRYFVRARPVGASPVGGSENQFTLMLQPMEVIYVQPSLPSGGVLAHRKFEDADNYFAETFTASDFPELKERVSFDLAAIQLLRVKMIDEATLDASLDNLMAETFYYENQRGNFVPNRFFTDMRYFEPAKTALYRDRYRNWIKARAEALGSKFVVTHSNDVSAQQCGQLAMLRQDYDVLGQWGMDTSGMIANAAKVLDASQKTGETTTMPDHLYFLGAVEEQNLSCNNQALMGTLSLDGVGLVHAQSANQPYYFRTRQIDFVLSDVTISKGRNDIPLLAIKGIATETRYYDTPMRSIAGIQPVWTIANTDGVTAHAKEAEAVGNTTEAETVPAEKSPWPFIEQVAFSKTGHDTVGITLGMSMDEAETIIASEFDITIGYETIAPSNASEPAFNYVRVYFIGGATQAITLMSYSPNGPIMAVNRHLLRNDAPWPQNAITASLVDKYNEPVARASDDTSLVWAGSEDCANLPLSPFGQRELEPLGTGEINGAFDPDLAAFVIGSIATVSGGNETFLESKRACGETVMYSARLLKPVVGYHGFYTFMTDISAVQAVSDALKVEETETSSGPKIKF